MQIPTHRKPKMTEKGKHLWVLSSIILTLWDIWTTKLKSSGLVQLDIEGVYTERLHLQKSPWSKVEDECSKNHGNIGKPEEDHPLHVDEQRDIFLKKRLNRRWVVKCIRSCLHATLFALEILTVRARELCDSLLISKDLLRYEYIRRFGLYKNPNFVITS